MNCIVIKAFPKGLHLCVNTCHTKVTCRLIDLSTSHPRYKNSCLSAEHPTERNTTVNHEDDEDMMPSASCLSSQLSLRASRAATGSAQHGRSTLSSSLHAQHEQPVLPSLSHV